MDLLLKIIYYAFGSVSTLVISFFFLAHLFDTTGPTRTLTETLIFLASGSTAMGLLYLSFRLGQGQGHWMAAIGLTVVADVVFPVMIVLGLFLFTTVHWQ